MAKPLPGKPLIFAEPAFEGLNELIDLRTESWDDFYVPGYSEKIRINEQRVRDGHKALPMDRLQWVRISKGANGDISETDKSMYQWLRLGYRAVGTDYLKEQGYGFPPAATPAADGTIRIGDTALFMVPATRADQNRAVDAALRAAAKPAFESGVDGLEVIEDNRIAKQGLTLKEAYDAPLPTL